MTQESPPNENQPTALELKDLTVADVIRTVRRLKVSALALCIGVAASAIGGAMSYARALDSQKLDAMAAELATANAKLVANAKLASPKSFQSEFERFTHPGSGLKQVVQNIQEKKPDGLSTEDQVMASLLWQLKGQHGMAVFLTGDKSLVLRITSSGGSLDFQWDEVGNSLVTQLQGEGQPLSSERLAQLNSQLNVFGVAWLDPKQYVVRTLDGGTNFILDQ